MALNQTHHRLTFGFFLPNVQDNFQLSIANSHQTNPKLKYAYSVTVMEYMKIEKEYKHAIELYMKEGQKLNDINYLVF